MREIIYLLLQQPFLLLLLVVWLLSAVASAAAKANKRAQQRRRAPEMEAYLEQRRQQREAAARTQSPAQPQSAEDIARQLREMLGIETVAPPPAPARTTGWEGEADREQREESGEAEAPEHEERPHYVEPEHGDEQVARGAAVGELHEKIKQKRHSPTAVGRSVARHIGHEPAPTPTVRKAVAWPRPTFDAQSAVQAVIALEVLGPPRALRPWGPDA